MIRFVLSINCADDAFGDTPHQRAQEVARILRDASEHLEQGRGHELSLRDVNGNHVGEARFTKTAR